MTDVVGDPLPPFNPQLMVTRTIPNDYPDMVVGDTDLSRWEILGAREIFPDLATGGGVVVFASAHPDREEATLYTRALDSQDWTGCWRPTQTS